MQEAEEFFEGDKEEWDQLIKYNAKLFDEPQEYKQSDEVHKNQLLTHRKAAAMLLHSEVVGP